jgi:hypothetical protein
MVYSVQFLEIKLKTRISKIDFIFLTKTWTKTCLNIPGFETIVSQMAKPVTNQAC